MTRVAVWGRILLLLVLVVAGFRLQAGDAQIRVEAIGQAYVASPADRDAARRRAIGEALVSAALSGGAALRGHTVVDKGRILADLTILRPTGRVISHRVLSARLDAGRWDVRIEATVAPEAGAACAGRRLTISATPPRIQVAAQADAWAEPLAQSVANGLIETVRRHPSADLVRLASASSGKIAPGMDYSALMSGRAPAKPGDHRLCSTVTVEPAGQNVRLTLDLSLDAPDGRNDTYSFQRKVMRPGGGVEGFLVRPRRERAEQVLTAGLFDDVRNTLDQLTCEPVQARIVRQGDGLGVPLGRQHGLTRASLAFVDDPNDSFGLLEIIELGSHSVRLRPLDPARSVQSFDGLRVYFLEAGF